MKYFHKLSNVAQGAWLNVLACFFASIMVAIVHHLSKDFHVFFIVMLRNLFGLAFFLPHFFRSQGSVFKTSHLKLHLTRGVIGMTSMFFWFYSVSILPLAEATAISFVGPILTMMVAVFFLKEKVHHNVWIACFVGFLGVLITIRPGFRELHFAHLSNLIAVALWAITNALIKTMTKTEKPQTIVAYMTLVMFFFSIPFAAFYMQVVDLESAIYFVLLGLFSNLTHLCISSALSKADLSYIQPFDFTRLIFTVIIAYFLFSEPLDYWVFIGSAVIFLGIMITASKKSRWKKNIEPVIN
jgi:drug/metabolite transporter (DMT)-like permease